MATFESTARHGQQLSCEQVKLRGGIFRHLSEKEAFVSPLQRMKGLRRLHIVISAACAIPQDAGLIFTLVQRGEFCFEQILPRKCGNHISKTIPLSAVRGESLLVC